jgi:hypothetical protein
MHARGNNMLRNVDVAFKRKQQIQALEKAPTPDFERIAQLRTQTRDDIRERAERVDNTLGRVRDPATGPQPRDLEVTRS